MTSDEYISSLVQMKLRKKRKAKRASGTTTVRVVPIEPWSCPAQCPECRAWAEANEAPAQ